MGGFFAIPLQFVDDPPQGWRVLTLSPKFTESVIPPLAQSQPVDQPVAAAMNKTHALEARTLSAAASAVSPTSCPQAVKSASQQPLRIDDQHLPLALQGCGPDAGHMLH
jgi:hypothetical protein